MREQLNIGSSDSTDESVDFGRLPDLPPEAYEMAGAAAKLTELSFDEMVERICKPHKCKWTIVAAEYGHAIVECTEHWCMAELPLDEANAILNQQHRWGLHNFHPPSFGVGFLLSTLFWLTIGIALQLL